MTTKTEYAPGTPCWVDLATTDPAAAKDFYAALFGWTYDDQDTGGGGVYSIVAKDGKVVGGLAQQSPDMKAAGAPPMWSTYVAVADADASASKVEDAGGNVMAPPFDVMEAGRMSVCADPSGAVFCLWQGKSVPGAMIVNEPGAFTWNELLSPDVEGKEAAFYQAVFGWEANTQEMGPMRYTEFRLNGAPVAGGMKPPMDGIPPNWGVYFQVTDTDQTVETATARGASVLNPPTDIPPGRFAVLMDPQGAPFNVITPTAG